MDINEMEKSKAFITVEIVDYIPNSVVKSKMLQTGQPVAIPAHAPDQVNPNGRFKRILTIIKSGYE